jgi:hypothetical protein
MTATRTAPCPIPGCPFRLGPGEHCPDHDGEAPRPVVTLTRGQRLAANRARAEAALLRDPARTNPAIARLTRTNPGTVMRIRHQLERAGLIPAWRKQWPPSYGRPHAGITAELLRDPRRSNRVIAGLAGGAHMTVTKIRHELERAGQIPVYRAPSSRRARVPAARLAW